MPILSTARTARIVHAISCWQPRCGEGLSPRVGGCLHHRINAPGDAGGLPARGPPPPPTAPGGTHEMYTGQMQRACRGSLLPRPCSSVSFCGLESSPACYDIASLYIHFTSSPFANLSFLSVPGPAVCLFLRPYRPARVSKVAVALAQANGGYS